MKHLLNRQLWLSLAASTALFTSLPTSTRAQATSTPIITPAVDDQQMAQALANGQALMANPKWKVEIQNSSSTLSWTGEELVGFGQQTGGVYQTGLDPKNGDISWETKPVGSFQPMTEKDGTITFLSLAGAGKKLQLWEKHGPDEPFKSVWEAVGGNNGSGTFDEQHLYFAEGQVNLGSNPDGKIVRRFDRHTGEQQWKTQLPPETSKTSRPIVAGDKVYVVAELSTQATVSTLVALSAADGKLLWQSPVFQARQMEPVAFEQSVITATEWGEVIAYDAQTGKEKWHTAVSPVCDAAKSRLNAMDVSSRQMVRDGDRLLIPVASPPQERPSPKFTPASSPSVPAAGIAVFDLASGKQTGFHNALPTHGANGKTATPTSGVVSLATPTSLQLYKDTIGARVEGGYMGINRKTLQLEWYIKCVSAVLGDGILYVNTTGNALPPIPAAIYALPLDGFKVEKRDIAAVAPQRAIKLDLKDSAITTKLLKDLAGADFATREAAQQKLEDVELWQLKELKDLATGATDAEVKARLAARANALEYAGVVQPDQLTNISIDIKDATLDQVAAALAKATNVHLEAQTPPAPYAGERYTLKMTNKPFWQVFMALAQQHAIWFDRADPTRLVRDPEQALLQEVGHGLLMRAGAVSSARGGISHSEVVLAVDPRMDPVTIHDAKLEGGAGTWQVPGAGGAGGAGAGFGGPSKAPARMVDTNVTWNLVAGLADISMQGQFAVDLVDSKVVVIVSPEEKIGQKVNFGDLWIKADQFDVLEGQVSAFVTWGANPPATKPANGKLPPTPPIKVWILDAKGNVIWMPKGTTTSFGSTGMGFSYKGIFAEPLRLVARTSSTAHEVVIPFNIDHIPVK